MARTKRSSHRAELPPQQAAIQPPTSTEPVSDPGQALALVETPDQPGPIAQKTETAQSLSFAGENQPPEPPEPGATTNSLTMLDPATTMHPVRPTTQSAMPTVQPPEPLNPQLVQVPLYLQNPGPPPRLPRNQNVNHLGRLSYRYKGVEPGQANYRWLLWVCATIGLVILYLLLIVKIQNRPITEPVTDNSAALTPTAVARLEYPTVIASEQFALVMAAQARVRTEPVNEAATVQTLQRYTLVALQNRAPGGWYQLKGGSGWLMAASLEFYADADSAWAAKRKYEQPKTPIP